MSIYTNLKIFCFKDKIDSLPKEVETIKAPIHIRIKPTNVCNHRCSYCAYRTDNLQLGKDMVEKDFIPKDKMMEIIDDCIEMDVKAITFSGGGDPFCYPYLFEAVKKLSNSKIKFAALTNGSRLFGDVAEIFAYKATWLRVSMDGWDDESYQKYRGIKDYTKIMNNIEKFNNLKGKCFLGISLIVDRMNATHVYESLLRLKNVGARSVKISGCVVSNSGKENNKYHKDIFNEVKEQIKKCKNELASEEFEIYDTYHSLDDNFDKNYDWCPYLQILPVIGADMNIYPCQDKAYNLEDGLIGSIKNIRFKDFWFNDKNNFYKINPSKVCNHHCVANNKNKLIFDYLNVNKDHLEFV